MITLSGTLHIHTIQGQNGDFKVGRLWTEIGEFSVPGAWIEPYQEGRYAGEFGVAEFYPAHHRAAGRLVIEVGAKIETIALSDGDHLARKDPIAEEAPARPVRQAPLDGQSQAEPSPRPGSTPKALEAEDPEAELRHLFGALYPLGATVRLDPRVGHALFRQQRDTLKQLGYRFVPSRRQWETTTDQG